MRKSDHFQKRSWPSIRSWRGVFLISLLTISLSSCGGDSAAPGPVATLRCAVKTEHEQTATGVSLGLKDNVIVFLDGSVQPDPGVNDSGGRGWDVLRYSLPEGASFHLDAASPAIKQISFGPIAGQKVQINHGQSHKFINLAAGEYELELLPSGEAVVALAITSDLCGAPKTATRDQVLPSYVDPGVTVNSMPQSNLYAIDPPASVNSSVASELAFAESVMKVVLQAFVFSPNDPLTWQTANQALTSELTTLYNQGYLFQGATPEQAFQVLTGLSVEPGPEIILGLMIVEVSLNLKGTDGPIELTYSQILSTD
ncbi:MAG: hypothetical protein J0M12_10560 [Deltaproteobacteria bacterium]|nr:hypothetical protein [Deltaproteobacteria bacterium]